MSKDTFTPDTHKEAPLYSTVDHVAYIRLSDNAIVYRERGSVTTKAILKKGEIHLVG